jgi:hypothetical protein
MQFTSALKFYFQSEKWFRKVFAPAVCLFIPLVGLAAVTGWALEVCRRVIRKDPDPLPAMNFRRNLRDGIAVWGIVFVYGLPLVLWLGAGAILSIRLFPAGRESSAVSFDLIWWGIELTALMILLGAEMGIIAAIGRFADSGTFRAAFRLRDIFSTIRLAPIAFFLAVLAWLPLGLLAVSGIAVCGVGALFTTAYALGSGFHLAGQAYVAAAERVASGSVSGRV